MMVFMYRKAVVLFSFQDTDGDDQYDTKEVLLSGFDDHDTHHAIAAFCTDPSGAIYMAEGVFLHSNVETVYGPVRGTNGGELFRTHPRQRKLTRYAQFRIPNPWGIAFDDFGQDFFLHTSGTSLSWMRAGAIKAVYGSNLPAPNIIKSNAVRPTSGLEFVSSRHFPDEVQGDILLNNAIGFLGAKQHQVIEDGTDSLLNFAKTCSFQRPKLPACRSRICTRRFALCRRLAQCTNWTHAAQRTRPKSRPRARQSLSHHLSGKTIGKTRKNCWCYD